MGREDAQQELRATQEAIATLAGRFADAAGEALATALHRRVEELIVARADWFNALDSESVASLRRSVDDAITGGARDIAEQLRDGSLWIEPATLREVFVETAEPDPDAPRYGVEHSGTIGGERLGPTYFERELRVTGRRVKDPLPSEALDDPMNRVWVRLTNGADRLDGVLTEFGLTPNALPDPGGGHFGLQPRSAAELDPSGGLTHLWREYVELYARHRKLSAKVESERSSEAGEEALRRWREPG